MSDADIEKDVELFLRDYNPELLRTPQPLNVEDFAEYYLGLGIHYDYLSHNGCIWGRMVFNNRRIPVYVPEKNRADYCDVDADTILVDNSLLDGPNEFAFRSTVMHECGHSIYHPQIYRENDDQLSFIQIKPSEKEASTVCRTIDIAGTKKGGRQRSFTTDRDWVEHHAKYLM